MIDTNKPISKVTYKGEELPMKGGYPEPTGSINITENGTYNVKDKAEAVVNVSEQIKTLDSVPDTKVADIIVVSGDYYLWKEGA